MRTCLVLLAALLAGSLCPAASHAALPATVDGEPLPSLAPMLERLTPAVVNVHSKSVVRVQNPLADHPLFRDFWGRQLLPQERVRQSLGSGVIVDAQRGLILTNNHVIAGADDIQITLADGRTLPGELVGSDEDTDVAVIKVEGDGLVAAPLAESARLRVGDFVVAVGNPFGLGQSVTSGIVSALGRSGLQGLGYQNFIQTDASINSGNSGGALVNLRGELVGINTAIFSPSGGNVGIGFAIPSDLARDVMQQLLAYGEVRRGSLGLQTQDLGRELARLLNIEAQRGAVVTRVYPDTPAQRAGLRPGDVVTAIDGKRVDGARTLHNLEGLLPTERAVKLEVLRDGRTVELTAVLQAQSRLLRGADLDARLGGATFAELPQRLKQRGVSGVRIDAVAQGSRAARNGLREGDLVLEVNRAAVDGLGALRGRVQAARPLLVLTIVRGGRAFAVAVE